MEAQENLRESHEQDASTAGADDHSPQETTRVTPHEEGASPAADGEPCGEGEWICIWPLDSATVKKFLPGATTRLDT